MSILNMKKTFREILHNGYVQEISISKKIVEENSEYQLIQLFDSPILGKFLALDQIIQISERDEFAYSEMLTHIPILSLAKPEDILIVGGGDGAVAEEIIKHKDIKSLELVEIDKRVIEISKKHLTSIHHGSFNNQKLNIIIKDASVFLNLNSKKYDIIIADRPDDVGAATSLFRKEFYINISKALKSEGIAIFQTGVIFFQKDVLLETLKNLRSVFKFSGIYVTTVPSYVGGFMAISWGSNRVNLEERINFAKNNPLRKFIETKYYNSKIHEASFSLPQFINEIIQY